MWQRAASLSCADMWNIDAASVGDPWHFDTGPDPDPTFFFIDIKDAKQNIFSPYFILIFCPQAHHVQSKNLIFAKILR